MEKPKKPIFVTQPSLPNLDDFHESLKEIWESKWITNKGPFHQKFETELATHLGVNYVSLFNNGTIAL
ncbi:MAG: DegT/DnrJ/EryC1/StrS family aminotransferase, partial [Flavobacteriales bacterium]|nr:DegT/DnrJ/EryC1/StrS family aminotransferase [Flavobacteriales bacterium]